MSGLLELEDVHVWFDLEEGGELHAVQGVSFSVEPGERLGLVGESGCGKTTTALTIMGLLPPSAEPCGWGQTGHARSPPSVRERSVRRRSLLPEHSQRR